MTKLVKHGQIQLGSFDRALDDANLVDAKPECLRHVPRPLRSLRLKEWQAFQIGTPRYFLIVALFDPKFASLAQIKLYDKATKRKYFFERILPPWTFRNTNSLRHSTSRFRAGGVEIRFENRLDDGYLAAHLYVRRADDFPDTDAVFKLHAKNVDPMIRAIPFEGGRAMYSHKGLMPVTGDVRIGDDRFTPSKGDSFGFVDHHKGYYGREMTWDWVTAAGFEGDSLVGFNLTRNASLNRERFNENGFWRDGRLHTVGPVNFSRISSDNRSWRIFDQYEDVDVTFHLETEGRMTMNYGIIKNEYDGPFGRFEGHIRARDGEELDVDGFFGMGEEFYLKA